nr:unnamed protein product [Digitaria exilis]
MASASATSILLFPATTPVASTPSACPSKKSILRRRRRTVSCRASGADDDGLLWLPRRGVLTSLTGAAAGLVSYPNLTSIALEANPVDTCKRGEKVSEKLVECSDPNRDFPCPPSLKVPIVDFKPESTVKRIRRPAHLLDEEYQKKYKKAIRKMKDLEPSNPLSFAAQAAIHESYCDGHYRYDPTEKNRPFDVHFSWIFAPWHRMYIYFYEKALGDLVGDDTFALPYWNWDSPEGMGIPAIFKDPNDDNPLYDPNRDMTHRDALIDLDYLHADKGVGPIPFVKTPATAASYDAAVDKNLATIYQQQIRGGRGPCAFLGEKLCSEASIRVKEINERSKRRQNGTQIKTDSNPRPDVPSPTACSVTTASRTVPYDMGFLGTAGRDPLFYSHHSNVDRMWHLWSTKLGNEGFTDPEWLDASFVFYDNYKEPRLVRIKFRDVLDARNLGYTYDAESEASLPWINSKPTPLSPDGGSSARSGAAAPPEFPLTLVSEQAVVVPGVAVPAKEAGKDLVL